MVFACFFFALLRFAVENHVLNFAASFRLAKIDVLVGCAVDGTRGVDQC